MSEENPSATGFERLEAIERLHHRIAIENIAREASFTQRLAEIAGIRRQDRLPAVEPQAERLVARGVAVGWHAYDRAVAKDIVLAVDDPDCVADVEIAAIIAMRYGDIGIEASLPFPALHDHRRVRDEGVAPDMIEMKV